MAILWDDIITNQLAVASFNIHGRIMTLGWGATKKDLVWGVGVRGHRLKPGARTGFQGFIMQLFAPIGWEMLHCRRLVNRFTFIISPDHFTKYFNPLKNALKFIFATGTFYASHTKLLGDVNAWSSWWGGFSALTLNLSSIFTIDCVYYVSPKDSSAPGGPKH